MKLLNEKVKIDTALTSAALNGASTAHLYFRMDKYRKACFIVDHGAMAAAATSAAQVMQATDASGTSAKVVTGVVSTVTANAGVAAMTITASTVLVADYVVINGLTFTAAAAESLTTRAFNQSAGDNATATSLAACINHATYGVPGVTATANSAVVTLTATEPGDVDITTTSSSATLTLATTKAVSFVEVDAAELDNANGFDHVAVRVTNSTSQQTSAICLREGRGNPEQTVAAQYPA